MREGLYLGDLSGPESRLTLLWLGVRGVVTVASHDIERLWMADGIAYHITLTLTLTLTLPVPLTLNLTLTLPPTQTQTQT